MKSEIIPYFQKNTLSAEATIKEQPKPSNWELLKALIPFLRPYKKQITMIVILVPIVAALDGFQPYMLKGVIDQFINSDHSEIPYGWYLAGLVLGSFCFTVMQNFLIQAVGQEFVADIRAKLFIHIQSLSIDFFERHPVGKLLTRLTNDIEALSEMFGSGLIGFINDSISLFGTVIFMLLLDWRLTLVQLSLIPILILCTQVFERFYREANTQSRNQLSQLNSLFQESIRGLLVVKLFLQETFMSKRFDSINQRYIKSNTSLITADSAFSAVIELMGLIGIISVLVVVVIFPRDYSPGSIVAFVSYSQMLFTPIRSLSEKFVIFQSGFTAIERVMNILEEKPLLLPPQDPIKVDHVSTIRFEGVGFKYDPVSPKYILSDLSFELAEGESLGIVGRTGSGKSTLIKLLCRFYDPLEGAIKLGDYDLRRFDTDELRKHMLMVPQRSFLFSGTIRENLLLDSSLDDHSLKRLAERTGLLEMIEDFPLGLDTPVREGGIDLSSGQRQLISLTRAIVQAPLVLILDEATANLDPYTESLVSRATRQILQCGKTVIFIAHRLNLVQNCDQIMVLHQGKIAERGNHETLLAQKKIYSHLHSLSTMI
ncbi:MAG: ABC transporter ATP-binding protein [Candidatus Caenarcaniphilales bacterium]|nr:ABC transporter ATP-binding protein [Candidatus Caenarcaniphilales bacterium]